MAKEERKKEDLFIKERRRAKNFFITSSAKMDNNKGVSKTTISSSVFTKMSQSFADGEYLLDDGIREINGSVLYMLQEMQKDIDDLYNEASASAFQSSYFPVARIDSGSFSDISSSGLITMMTASIGGGIFTSASLAAGGGGSTDFTSVDSVLAPDADNSRDLGYSNREWRNLYLDGTAYIDSIDGGTLTKPLALPYRTSTSLKSSAVDATTINVLILNSSKALNIQTLTAHSVGQELTIMNIGSGAVTITRSTKASARTIYGSNNLTINQHQAYKFVCSPAQVWYQIS